jgi:hypothetical protein
MDKIIIGKCEFISFPKLNMINIEAKIDTGAYTTALHCHDIIEKVINEKKVLSFKLLDPLHPNYNNKEIIFQEYDLANIKNSFGETETRFIIKTQIKLGKKLLLAKVSLTNRGNMRYPVLLGRRILKRRFIVDVSKEFVLVKNDKIQTS